MPAEAYIEALQSDLVALREANAKLVEALEGALRLLEMDGSRHNVWRAALAAAKEHS